MSLFLHFWFFFRDKCLFFVHFYTNMKKILYDLEAINWFSLNETGSVSLYRTNLGKKKSAIYVYQYIVDKNIIYIGSSNNVVKRLEKHSYSCNKNIKGCPKFYNYVNKYGWINFRVGILEYIDFDTTNKLFNKRILLEREQFYFDIFKPTLNINKAVRNTLYFKHLTKTGYILHNQWKNDEK